jgi:putative transposase
MEGRAVLDLAEGLQFRHVRAMGAHRIELLNETMFRSLAHACEVLIEWRQDYNGERPHTSFNGLIPNEFARRSTSDHNQNGLQL